jgi:hypothetical protein
MHLWLFTSSSAGGYAGEVRGTQRRRSTVGWLSQNHFSETLCMIELTLELAWSVREICDGCGISWLW